MRCPNCNVKLIVVTEMDKDSIMRPVLKRTKPADVEELEEDYKAARDFSRVENPNG